MSSLCYELFGRYAVEGLKQDKNAFETYFDTFEERAKKCMGRLIAMSKKLNGEGIVDKDIKVLKIKILGDAKGTVKNVNEHITEALTFNEVICRYVSIQVNQGTAKTQCDGHIAALKSLLESKESINAKVTAALKTKTEEDDKQVQNILENFKQVTKHLFISADRLTGSVRLESGK